MTVSFIWAPPAYGRKIYAGAYVGLYDKLSIDFDVENSPTVPQYVLMNQPPVGMRNKRKRRATEYHGPNTKR